MTPQEENEKETEQTGDVLAASVEEQDANEGAALEAEASGESGTNEDEAGTEHAAGEEPAEAEDAAGAVAAVAGATKDAASGKTPLTGREKVLGGVAAVAVVAAIAGFGLFAASNPAGAAAKFDGGNVQESEVAAYIEQYRNAYGLTDDTQFASTLTSQNMTVASYRQNAVDQLVIGKLIEKRAKELGVSVSDEEVEARLQQIYGQIAGDDDSIWKSTLESMGVTEDDLRSRYRADLLQEKVCKADVAQEQASDEDMLSYITSYLADSTQKHVYHIVFTSDEGKTQKASECADALKKAKKDGTLNAAEFEKLAAQYSESSTVADDKGVVGWTGSGVIPSDITDLIDGMGAGDVSDPTTIEEDDGDAYEIVYVDEEFSFPEASKITSLNKLKVPDGLLDIIRSAAGQGNWQQDCQKYLAKLLAGAKVTYYPVPDSASYNVDLG